MNCYSSSSAPRSPSFLFPCVLDSLISRIAVSYTSIVVIEAGIAPIKLVPIPEYRARQPSSRQTVASVLRTPRYGKGVFSGNLPLVHLVTLREPLPLTDKRPCLRCPAEHIGARACICCCVCNLVRMTSCGYVATVAHALLIELAISIPRIWRHPWSLCQSPSPDPVKYLLNFSYNGNCTTKCVTPSRAGASPV